MSEHRGAVEDFLEWWVKGGIGSWKVVIEEHCFGERLSYLVLYEYN